MSPDANSTFVLFPEQGEKSCVTDMRALERALNITALAQYINATSATNYNEIGYTPTFVDETLALTMHQCPIPDVAPISYNIDPYRCPISVGEELANLLMVECSVLHVMMTPDRLLTDVLAIAVARVHLVGHGMELVSMPQCDQPCMQKLVCLRKGLPRVHSKSNLAVSIMASSLIPDVADTLTRALKRQDQCTIDDHPRSGARSTVSVGVKAIAFAQTTNEGCLVFQPYNHTPIGDDAPILLQTAHTIERMALSLMDGPAVIRGITNLTGCRTGKGMRMALDVFKLKDPPTSKAVPDMIIVQPMSSRASMADNILRCVDVHGQCLVTTTSSGALALALRALIIVRIQLIEAGLDIVVAPEFQRVGDRLKLSIFKWARHPTSKFIIAPL